MLGLALTRYRVLRRIGLTFTDNASQRERRAALQVNHLAQLP